MRARARPRPVQVAALRQALSVRIGKARRQRRLGTVAAACAAAAAIVVPTVIRGGVSPTAAPPDTSGHAVDINGDRGFYQADSGRKSSVNWAPAPHTLLILSAGRLALPEKELLRIARSLRPETGTVDAPVRWPSPAPRASACCSARGSPDASR